ncbi:MAG: hypothetical protein HKN20_05845 [Gemmatimonadetes bacterium]|nr:hypothetical protein [Gemmatimonadota bacterium]
MSRIMMVGLIAALALYGCAKNEVDFSEEQSAAPAAQAANDAFAPSGEAGAVFASVNGTPITTVDVDNEVARIYRQMGGGQISPFQAEQMKEQLFAQAQDNLINKIVLYDAVKEQRIEVAEEELAARFKEYRDQFPSQEVFDEQIRRMGFTEQELKEEMAMNIQIQKLLESNTEAVSLPSTADCREFYDANVEAFSSGEEVHASHILLRLEQTADEAAKSAAQASLADLRKQIVAGADFAELATAHSDCPSKAQGGDLGWFERGRMVEPFDNAVFNLKPGEISPVIETQFGYHIIKCAERKPAETKSFDEVKNDIQNGLQEERRNEQYSRYIEELRGKADVKMENG